VESGQMFLHGLAIEQYDLRVSGKQYLRMETLYQHDSQQQELIQPTPLKQILQDF